MKDQILGLHHITAIAGNAQRNYDFYTKVLGLRFVKKTVNFDDPGTYHFYYGDEEGTPGTILTFFPWGNIGRGHVGTGMATEIGYSVPPGSLDFWEDRFRQFNVSYSNKGERFGETFLPFRDPDGLNINLIVPDKPDERKPWETTEIKKDTATKGFHNVTLMANKKDDTEKILIDIFGYHFLSQEGNRYRYITDAVENASIIDIIESPEGKRGNNAGGTNHHVAFRVADEDTQITFREKLVREYLQVTPKINRDYFYSIYFREPGGVLFEIATENPGFTVDEPLTDLGKHLKLPAQYENVRADIEKTLPVLQY
ncbi:MAG: ring-cleaving dioxygenase [Ginsengibacter sp.]